jgi:hypothetical protein
MSGFKVQSSVQLQENSSPCADAHTECERLPVRTKKKKKKVKALFSLNSFSVLANFAFLDFNESTFLSNAQL